MRLLSILLLAGFVACANAAPSLTDVAYGPEPEQRFDLHAPPGAQAAPLILMVHGGAWRLGDKEMGRVVDNKVARWVPRGIAFRAMHPTGRRCTASAFACVARARRRMRCRTATALATRTRTSLADRA